MKRKVIIDCDPGIDDALAILLAIASPELEIVAISVVHGNCSTEQGVLNALSVLELAKRSDIPVFQGCELPIVQAPLLAPETHGNTGLGYAKLPSPQTKPQSEHAVNYLIRKFMAEPGTIDLLAIGPLTNLAMALRLEPRLVAAIPHVFVMGGAIREGGNTTPLAEFNTYVDPHAAAIVLHSGLRLTLTPLDVTYKCIFKPEMVQALHAAVPGSGLMQFIDDATKFYIEFHDEYQEIEGCVINDPLTLALLFEPGLCTYEDHFVDVDIGSGVGLGKTFADFYRMKKKPNNVRVALGVRPADFLNLFQKRMISLAQQLTQPA